MKEIKPQRNVMPLREAESMLKDIYLETINQGVPAEKAQYQNRRNEGWDKLNEEIRESRKNLGAKDPIRIVPKIGRNEPCPCGSGKKYKKCCGKEEQ